MLKDVSTKSLLEEPRAELTSLHTMKLLFDNNMATEAEIQKVREGLIVFPETTC